MKDKVAFIWQGINGRYGQWKDGLWLAMQHLEKEYDVTYHDIDEDIPGDAIVLYWEAPCTINGQYSENYRRIMNLPNKKILLFAGGLLKKEWVTGFDMLCVESAINAKECEEQGIPYLTAFGINEEVMKPLKRVKKYDGIHHGTCASWKRQWLVGEALGDKGLVVGRYQESDPMPFDECRKYGTKIMDEQTPESICELLNESVSCLQTSDYWGGGQRCTLEAMACNIPVIVMEDSPKNREYVQESGFGLIVNPSKEAIINAVREVKTRQWGNKGREYVLSKWTGKHYADNIIKAINLIK